MRYVTTDQDNGAWVIFDDETMEVIDQFATRAEADNALNNMEETSHA